MHAEQLIRYSTDNGLVQNLSQNQIFRRVLRPRVLVYTAVLGLVTVGMLWSLAVRTSFKFDVQRDRGSIARSVGQGLTENVYRLQIMNATEHSQAYSIQVAGLDGLQIVANAQVVVDAASPRWVPVRVQAPPGLSSGSHPISFTIAALGVSPEEVIEKSVFLVPR